MANEGFAGVTPPAADAGLAAHRAIVQTQTKRGANWFYWIAGLSVINSVLMLSGSHTRFVVGLGVTTLLDAMGREVGGTGSGVTMGVSLGIAGLFVLFGYFGNKLQIWSFVVGMALYALDGLLLLKFQEMLSVAFHGLALFYLFRGFSAARQAAALKPVNTPLG